MSPATVRLDSRTGGGSYDFSLLAQGGTAHRVDRITASGSVVADWCTFLLNQAWEDREVWPEPVSNAFRWFVEVTGQIPLPLATVTSRYRVRTRHRDTELRWLEQHAAELAELAGCWVAVNGTELVSHGRNPKEALEAARRRGVERPLMFRVPGAEPDISFAAFD